MRSSDHTQHLNFSSVKAHFAFLTHSTKVPRSNDNCRCVCIRATVDSIDNATIRCKLRIRCLGVFPSATTTIRQSVLRSTDRQRVSTHGLTFLLLINFGGSFYNGNASFTINFNSAQSNVSSEKQSETIAEMCKELSQGFTILSNRAEQPMNSNAQQIRSAISITNRSAPKPPIEANVVNKKFGQLSNYTEDLLTNVKLPILTAEPCRRASPAMSLDSLSMTSNSLNATRLNTSTQSSVKQTDLDCFTGFEADFDKHFGSNGQPLSKDSPRKWTNQLPKPTLNGIITNSSMNESFAKPITNGSTITSSNEPFDPFDAEWVSLAARHGNDYIKNTNPFLVTTSAVKAFEIKM